MIESPLAFLGLGVGFVTTLVTTPVARHVALRLQILDRPRAGKVHQIAIPYLGGFAILGGFLAAVLFTGTWRELGGVTAAVGVLAVVGFLDDVRNMPATLRFATHVLAAGIAMTTGLLATPSDVEILNIAITLLWLVGITNAFNLLDNMNGLCAGTASIAAAFLFLMAAGEGQPVIAVLAAATSGATLGYLPYNFPKARIFMGDAGSVPLGFLIAVIALKVRFPVPQPWSFAVPVCVLWVAVVDTTIVVVDRLRSGRSIAIGGTDHLSHRLVEKGLSPTMAVSVLLSASVVMGLVGALSGRGVLSPIAMLVAGFVVGAGGIVLLVRRESTSTLEPRRIIREESQLEIVTDSSDEQCTVTAELSYVDNRRSQGR
jgi:UDP-GlcNAc:undecaprenyl-phosphate/decaprenyl-phosphate GlcNAc-1-phosphate transferase